MNTKPPCTVDEAIKYWKSHEKQLRTANLGKNDWWYFNVWPKLKGKKVI